MAEPVEPPTILSESSNSAMQGFNSMKVSLADLCAKGTAQYAHKNYSEAANFYAMASEMQAELNGEMSPDNAEVLFLYGRTLFKVGVSKSDVLGGKASGEEKKKSNKSNGAGSSKEKEGLPAVKEEESKEKIESEKTAEAGVAIAAEQKNGDQKEEEKVLDTKKPLFQFTGDENFEDSDDEEVEEAEGAEEEEEEDELASAFMVLDLARVLFTKKLEEPEAGDEKGKAVGDSPMARHIKERLADTHEILAEISLENEKFPEAVKDSRSALAYKIELYPEESEIIAEAHFKLSLALEFASITTTEDAPSSEAESHLDQSLRDEAVRELELAIKSCKLKLQNAEVQLASTSSPDDNDLTRTTIIDIKEMIADLEARLVELRGPPVDIKQALYGSDAMNSAAANSGGILAAALGEAPAKAAARLEEAKRNAHDITSVVRKKEKVKPVEANPIADKEMPSHNGTNGKRKAENDSEESGSKKVKVDDDLVKKSVEEPAGETKEEEKLEGVQVKDFAKV